MRGHQQQSQEKDVWIPYYQISPAGHCPHDEVPEVINFLLRGWIKNLESQGSYSLPLLDDSDSTNSTIAKELEFMREGLKKSVMVQYVAGNALIEFRLLFPINHNMQTYILNLPQVTFGEVVNVGLTMDRTAQIDGNIVKVRFTLPPRQKVSPPSKVLAVASKRDAPRADNASTDAEKDGPKWTRERMPLVNV